MKSFVHCKIFTSRTKPFMEGVLLVGRITESAVFEALGMDDADPLVVQGAQINGSVPNTPPILNYRNK